MPKQINPSEIFTKTCNIEGREGDYFIVRKGKQNSRVILVGEAGEGEKVKTSDLICIRNTNRPTAVT